MFPGRKEYFGSLSRPQCFVLFLVFLMGISGPRVSILFGHFVPRSERLRSFSPELWYG